ncbi:hypothetical protein ABFS83_03G036600 [Erythranthe nasuta]
MSCKRMWQPFLIIFILTPLFDSGVLAQYEVFVCSNNGNYSSESLYRSDLNGVLRSLSSKIDNTGFYSTSDGEASVIALCRADVELNACQGCVNIIAGEILTRCPNQYQAIMWSQYCMVRYSNETILGNLAMRPGRILYNMANSTSPDRFKVVRDELMDDVRAQAARGGSLQKAAAGNRTGPDNQVIFAMLQCTPDLSPENCTSCLVQAAGYIPGYIDDAIGVRVYTPSCIYRYETAPFYNITRLQESLGVPPSLTPPSMVPPPPPPPPPPRAGKVKGNRTRSIIIIVVSVVAFLVLVLGFGIFARTRTKQKTMEIDPNISGEISSVESIQYDFSKIRAATNDFSDDNKLGQGGFGAVYKGKLVNGQEIAVKRLSRESGQGVMEFKNEVLLLAKLQHRNLVRLLGFSVEGIERLLVYEFVPNGSLDQILFDRTKSSKLDWDSRYRSIVGIAKGVLYLHEDSRLMIIHRDLKASNVLLDENMNPKIADFGMAKLVVADATIESTNRIVGTYGYMAPEYASHGHFSVKSDVFSFGVIVLEIITGQRKIFTQNGENLGDLLSHAWRSWHEGKSTSMINPVLRETCGAQPDMMRCIHIALLCVQQNAADRPTMASVVVMLNSSTITLPIPKEPGFYFSGTSSFPNDEFNSNQFESSTPSQSLLTQSAEFSYSSSTSDLYPR